MKQLKSKKTFVKSIKDYDSTKEIDTTKPLNLDQVIQLSSNRKVKIQKAVIR